MIVGVEPIGPVLVNALHDHVVELPFLLRVVWHLTNDLVMVRMPLLVMLADDLGLGLTWVKELGREST